MTNMRNPVHPGEVLREWLEGHSQGDVAEALGISRTTLSRIINGHAGITADIDLRLSEALRTNPGFWLALQIQYQLSEAAKIKRKKIQPIIIQEAAYAQ